MTAPTIEKLPVRVPGRTLPPGLVHVSCDACNPKQTFCGIDIVVLRQAFGWTASCVVCAEMEKSHDWAGHFWGRP